MKSVAHITVPSWSVYWVDVVCSRTVVYVYIHVDNDNIAAVARESAVECHPSCACRSSTPASVAYMELIERGRRAGTGRLSNWWTSLVSASRFWLSSHVSIFMHQEPNPYRSASLISSIAISLERCAVLFQGLSLAGKSTSLGKETHDNSESANTDLLNKQ